MKIHICHLYPGWESRYGSMVSFGRRCSRAKATLNIFVRSEKRSHPHWRSHLHLISSLSWWRKTSRVKPTVGLLTILTVLISSFLLFFWEAALSFRPCMGRSVSMRKFDMGKKIPFWTVLFLKGNGIAVLHAWWRMIYANLFTYYMVFFFGYTCISTITDHVCFWLLLLNNLDEFCNHLEAESERIKERAKAG